MRMNHINLPVSDVGASRAFLETYFGLRSMAPDLEKGAAPDPDKIAAMMDESGSIVTLSNFNDADAVVYPGAFHIGFVQSSNEEVDTIYKRLRADGHAAGTPNLFHGSWTFYLKAPGNFTIEVLGPMPGLAAS